MKHYHGTPIGGKAADAAQFIERRLVLIPWKNPTDLQRTMDLSRGFIVDNSAFSFWSTGEKPDWREYYQWVVSFHRHPRFEWCILPDVIDGDEKENDELLKMWLSFYLTGAKNRPKLRVAPVWHMHESIERLERLCEIFDRVCIGSSGDYPDPGVGKWWDRMDEAFRAITDDDGYPKARIHGLRMLRQDIIERYPLYSGDSTNAAQNGNRLGFKQGTDTLWGQMTIARRTEGFQSPAKFIESAEESFSLFAE